MRSTRPDKALRKVDLPEPGGPSRRVRRPGRRTPRRFKNFNLQSLLLLIPTKQAGKGPRPQLEALSSHSQGAVTGGMLLHGVVKVIIADFRGMSKNALATYKLGWVGAIGCVEDLVIIWPRQMARTPIVL